MPPAFRAAIGLLVTAAVASAAAPEIRIVGSDLLGVEFSKAFYDFAGERGLRLALAFDGSRPGAVELRAGRASAGLLALPAAEEFDDADHASFPVGYHCVFVLVQSDCPLERISFDQLAGAFSGSGAAPIERWGDIGVTGEWTASPLVLLAPEAGAGLVTDYFRHRVLQGRPLKTNVERYRDFAALVRRIGPETRPIALVAGMPDAGHTLKCIAVAERSEEDAYLPTAENVHRGAYRLALPVRLVVRRDAMAAARPTFEFLLGEAAAAQFVRAGLVPVPAETRAQALAAVEKM